MEGKITIQETLLSANVSYGAFLIYSEVIEGARRPLVFFDTVTEDFSLIGATGNMIYVPTSTQLAATTSSQASWEESGMVSGFTIANKTIGKITITVTPFIYCAVAFSDILKEDYPNLDWLRLHLHNMGKAVLEAIDQAIETAYASAGSAVTPSGSYTGNESVSGNPDVYSGGYGPYTSVGAITLSSSHPTFCYNDVTNGLAAMAAKKWIADVNNPPFLIISPEMAAMLVQDTRFLLATRYYAGLTPDKLEGEVGLFAGCRVLQSTLLAGTGIAYIVFPPNFKWGPVAILAWKRKMRVREQRYEDKEWSIFATTARCIPVVIQSYGILQFAITGSNSYPTP